MKDYYLVLGITRNADMHKIKRAYRSIAKQYHPDISHSKQDAEHFLNVKEAYDTLSDEERRKAYDEQLIKEHTTIRTHRINPLGSHRKKQVLFEQKAHSWDQIDDFFEGFLPGFFHGTRREKKDLYVELLLTPREAMEGGLFPIGIPVLVSCPNCRKTELGDAFFCPVCFGRGRIQGKKEFSLSIPPRIAHATQVRLSLEDIGLRDIFLNIAVLIENFGDPHEW